MGADETKNSKIFISLQNTTFFQQSIIIEGNEKILPVGNSKYKFEFDLPEDGKGSFSSEFASVKYMMTCTADVPWGVDAEATNELFVTKIRDLNEDIESLEEADGQEDIAWLQRKILNMRIFNDADDKMNLSILDVQGEILAISQFTLHASTRKGNRPSFIKAAKPEYAEEIYDQFCTTLGESIPVKKGIFGAYMEVSLVNDGPVTIVIDSKNRE